MLGYEIERTDSSYRNLEQRYSRVGHALKVDFRKLVNAPSKSERATHLLHPYPAKLLSHIPFYFLANEVLSQPGSVVLDPFVGSGTVPLEALLSGRSAVSADSNPFARLLTRVKTSPICEARLRASANRLLSRIPDSDTVANIDVVNLEHWFYPHVVRKLSQIENAIASTRDEVVRDFFRVCFSVCVRKVSLADPRLSVPVRIKEGQYPEGHRLNEQTNKLLRQLRTVNVHSVFASVLEQNIKRLQRIEVLGCNISSEILSSDARTLMQSTSQRLNAETVDLVLTSPPYPGAQKYVRASSLSLGWLRLCESSELQQLKRQAIGREEFRQDELASYHQTSLDSANAKLKKISAKDPVRAAIAGAYIQEMQEVFLEVDRVLRPGGHVVIVIANSTIAGEVFHTAKYIRQLAEMTGFRTRLRLIDEIRSRGLMTKRNKTASVITREFVLVFEKES